MPSTYEVIHDIFFPLQIAGAIVVAYLVHEWVRDMFDDDDDEPDAYA